MDGQENQSQYKSNPRKMFQSEKFFFLNFNAFNHEIEFKNLQLHMNLHLLVFRLERTFFYYYTGGFQI